MTGMSLLYLSCSVLSRFQVDALAVQGTVPDIWPTHRLGNPGLILPLLQQPAWGRSREFEITTRSVGRNGGLSETTAGDLEEEEEEDDGSLVHGHRKRKVAFQPSVGKLRAHVTTTELTRSVSLFPLCQPAILHSVNSSTDACAMKTRPTQYIT